MTPAVKRTRTYSTTLRQEHARMTRQRILDAARRLLVSGTYSRVTMEEIAREAGVAYQTVYAIFGSKLQVAQALVEADWPHIEQALKLIDARPSDAPEVWLRTAAAIARRIYEPCVDIVRFMRESGDPDLLARHRENQRRRYDQLGELVPPLSASGRLRPTLTPADAQDLIWTMTGPDQYIQLVFERGWSPDRYEAWLGDALIELLLSR